MPRVRPRLDHRRGRAGVKRCDCLIPSPGKVRLSGFGCRNAADAMSRVLARHRNGLRRP
jgi:hypothetical protein